MFTTGCPSDQGGVNPQSGGLHTLAYARDERMAKKAKTSSKSKVDPGLKAVLDREPGLKTTLEQIDKTFGDGAIMPLGASQHLQIDGIQTGSLSLDMALGGQGIPRGRMIEVFGPESSGKTTLALHIGAEAQKKGGIAAIIDAEHAFDPSWAKKLGV